MDTPRKQSKTDQKADPSLTTTAESSSGGVPGEKEQSGKKKGGWFARLKKELNEGVEHSQERRDAAPKLSTRGVIGIGLGAGLK